MSDVAKSHTPPPSSMTEPTLTREPREYDHGRSPASWVGSMTALGGAVVGTIGFLAGVLGVIIAGFVIIGVALIATVMLRSMGYGQPKPTEGEK